METKEMNEALTLRFDKFGNEPEEDTILAMVALLCLMGLIDEDRAQEEYLATIKVAVAEYELSEQEAAHYYEVAEFLLRDPKKVDEFVDILIEAYDSNQRSHLLNILWDIARADGEIRQSEKDLYGALRERLRVDLLPSREEEQGDTEEEKAEDSVE